MVVFTEILKSRVKKETIPDSVSAGGGGTLWTQEQTFGFLKSIKFMDGWRELGRSNEYLVF
jgi:hypothetical protein